MRDRMFKLVFLIAMSVYLVCSTILLLGVMDDVSFVDLFIPLLAALVVAVALSAGLAAWASKSVTKPLNRIDFSRPDERDVEEEIKPLVRRLAEQNRQIRSQMETLAQEHEQQDQIRREFTANVSHELKTPLTSISGFADLMRNGMVKEEDVPRFSGKIYDEAQRMIALVGDIIRLSRLEDPSVLIRREPLSLHETMLSVQRQLAAAAEKSQIHFRVEGQEGKILSSPRIVEEILFNLCDNAVKYNRVGGSVLVTVREDPDGASVEVKDTGIGIPMAEQPRIFERFYRVDKSHSKEVGGTGLGLSIVKHGAADLGAELQVESALGRGTTVTVHFPHDVHQTAKEQQPAEHNELPPEPIQNS